MRYASWTYNLKLPTHPNGDAVLKVHHIMPRMSCAAQQQLTLQQAYRASLSTGINHW